MKDWTTWQQIAVAAIFVMALSMPGGVGSGLAKIAGALEKIAEEMRKSRTNIKH